MLCTTGKAAVIHPTGTGKSFIAFKLCEDYPDKRICWLSPSEYIFDTQIENLKATDLDEVFRKHMDQRWGKYIVFCSNKEHMDEMISNAPEWFGKVDEHPHIYSAYSDDPKTDFVF